MCSPDLWRSSVDVVAGPGGGSGSPSHSGGVLIRGGVLVGEALTWVKNWSMSARKRAVEVFIFIF